MLPLPRLKTLEWLINATGKRINTTPDNGKPVDDKAMALIQCRIKNEKLDQEDQLKKRKLIADALALIEPVVDKISDATDLTQTVKGDDGKVEKRDAKAKDLSEAMEPSRGGSFDSRKKPGGGDATVLAGQAMALIARTKERLLAETTFRYAVDKALTIKEGKKQPLFTDDEVSSELHTPLVRAGIIPDALVENSMSRNHKMIEKTNSATEKT